jgi:uncharacterized protein
MLEIDIRGERLQLLPDGALAWPRRRLLVIADPHFGKDDIFRRAGIAVPRGPTLRDLERLTAVIRSTASERVLIVGDFVHGRSCAGDDLLRQFVLWRARHPSLIVELVPGNHDRHEDWAPWRTLIDVLPSARHEPPFVFTHEPDDDPRGFFIAGHLHPVFKNSDFLGNRALRVFWRRTHGLVMPSWGEFTGGWRVDPKPWEGLYACTPEGVLPLQTGSPT